MKIKRQGVLLAVFFLLFGMSRAAAQEKNPQTVIIRSFEFSYGEESRITVTAPDGSTKLVELSFIDSRTLYGDAENSVLIQAQINEWKKQGFEIDAVTTQTSDAAKIITTIILSKD